jgi:hypothetical protein
MNDFTYYCAVDGMELPDSDFPTHEQVLEGLDPVICLEHQGVQHND